MVMKRCGICKQDRPKTEYNVANNRKDGLQSHCRECNKIRSKAYYSRNTVAHKLETKKRNKVRFKEIKEQLFNYYLNHPCEECGETNPLVLEFDHQHSKSDNISNMLMSKTSWKRIMEEIHKCKVLCANCHKIKTHKEQNTYRYRLLMTTTAIV